MDDIDPALLPSATGIMHCLRALAQEAAMLKLGRTLCAIEQALDAAEVEACRTALREDLFGRPAGYVLH